MSDFTAPSGRTYRWKQARPATQADIDKIVAFENDLVNREKSRGYKPGGLYDSEGKERGGFLDNLVPAITQASQTVKKKVKGKPQDPMAAAKVKTPLGEYQATDYASVTGKGTGGTDEDAYSFTGPSMTPADEKRRAAEGKRTGETRMPYGPLDVVLKPVGGALHAADEATRPIREPVQKAVGEGLAFFPSKVLGLGDEHPVTKFFREFGEFSGDPVNYIPVGAVSKVLKGKKGTAPVAAAEEAVEQAAKPTVKVKAGKRYVPDEPRPETPTLQPRQESIAKVRKDTGRKPYEREVIGTKEAIDGGRKLHADGQAGTIAAQFKDDKKRTLSGAETIALDLRGNQIIDELKTADATTVATLDGELDDILEALNKSGTRQSADFRARQLEYRRASDALVMMQRAQKKLEEAKPGTKLSEAEKTEITRLSGEVKRLQGELSKAEAQAAITQAEKARKIATGKVKRATRLEESRAKHDAGVQYWKDNPITTDVVGAIPIPKISGNHFDAVKDIVKYRLEAGVYKIADLVDEVKKVAGGISDEDIYLAIRQAAGEHGAVLNKGRALGEDIQVSGKSGIQSPEIMAARRALDKAKMEADAYIEKFRPKTVGSKIDEFATANVLLNPVARIFDAVANTAKAAGYVLQNPVRVGIGKSLAKIAGKEYGGEQLLFTGGKLKRVLEGAPARWKDRAIRAVQGTDIEEASKYGRGNIVSRLTGLTDIPFKDFYYRQAIDDAADNIAKSRKGGASMRDEILAQLEDPTLPGPLKPDELAEIASTAQDWALRQTFNSDNWASSLIEGAKRGIRQLAKGKGPLQEEAADLGIAAGNTFVRFSRVIGNVALERASYAVRIPGTSIPLGLVEGGLRTVFGFAKGTLNPNELRLIADLTTKGLAGMALFEWGKYLYRNGVYKPEIVKTENGTVYVDHGDLAQIGAWLTPILSGAAEEAIAKDPKLTDKQREQARWDNNVGLLADQPIASGTERGLKSLARGEDLVKVAGQTAANALLPGGVRDWARRQDSYIHRGTIFKERRVEVDGVGDQFKKGLPQTPLNPDFNRVKMKTKGKKKKRKGR